MSDQPLELVLEEGEWKWLRPHLDRNAIFVISLNLNLIDVGNAVLKDSANQVQKWIQDGLVNRPSIEQIQKWDSAPHTHFSFLILQPYVLIQEKIYN